MNISEYQVTWNINTNVGKIRVKYQGENQFTPVPLNNVNEFIAVLSILQGPGQAGVDRNGWLYSR